MFLYARTWTKKGESPDLRALWNHEVRTLLRINAYPRASEFFVGLRDLGVDEKRYFVILDAGDRVLLWDALEQRGRKAWLRDLQSPSSRRRIWEGLRRIATGLSILHGEGTIHRSLSAMSIFTDDQGNCDFRLSGFEWSLQVSTPPPISGRAASVQSSRIRAPELETEDARYSFATDWFDFGIFAAELFGLSVLGRGKRALHKLREAIAKYDVLGVSERAFLNSLLEEDPENRSAQGTTILQDLAEVAASVRNRNLSRGKPLFIGFRLGIGSNLSETIADLTRGTLNIELSDIESQLAFIQRDLSSDVSVVPRNQPFPHYAVTGRLLEYRVVQWELRNVRTWDAGYCTSCEGPWTASTERATPLGDRQIAVRTMIKVGRNLARIRTEGAAWDAVIPFEVDLEPLVERQRTVLEFFQLTNQLDAVLAAVQLWPVTVVSSTHTDQRVSIEITPVPDADRNSLAQNLGLPPTDLQMRDYLKGDPTLYRLSEDTEFTLAYEGVLGRGGDAEKNVRWRYSGVQEHPAGVRYAFYHEDVHLRAPDVGDAMFLTPHDLDGTVKQLYRRHTAIDAMRNHAGLLDTICEPWRMRRDIGEPNSPSAAGLDSSKISAIKGIYSTQPIFTLQGPPGTGKTRLLATLVDGVLRNDATAQILVTAQSHEAVRNARAALPNTLRTNLDRASSPIIIRLDDEDDADHVLKWTVRFASALASGTLASGVTGQLAERTKVMAEEVTPGQTLSLDMKSFQSLVRRAANVVFATSNSGDLARMLDDGRRFDWSIIEEAGKAHGFDLAQALQASHRILLMGDQDQLPPYNFEQFEMLFRDPPRILNALKVGGQYAPGLVDRVFMNFDPEDHNQFTEKCADWLNMVQFFADLFGRCERSVVNGVKIAVQLEFQHRMHPDIASLVSDCFYKGNLKTHDDAIARFNETPPPCDLVRNGWMPASRIVFVDLPWVQKDRHAVGERGGEHSGPRYTNLPEIEAAGRALSQFSGRSGSPCSIQVLSPYRAQVRALTQRIREEMAPNGQLANLRNPILGMDGKRLGATVDEFQGNEADVVVVSLVRNNDAAIGKGLGFLADPRRVNVLLSRAKQKLVIVGSWDFLASRVDCTVEPGADEKLAHIARFVRWLTDQEQLGRVARVRFNNTFWGSAQ